MQQVCLKMFDDFIKSKYDVRDLVDCVFTVTDSSEKSLNKNTFAVRQVWYDLTGSKQSRNMYSLQLPFLLRGIHESNKNVFPFAVTLINDRVYQNLQISEEREKKIDKKTDVLLISAVLNMKITEQPERNCSKEGSRREIWIPPRDVESIYDCVNATNTNIQGNCVPEEGCHVELFLSDLRYVSLQTNHIENPPPKSTLFEYLLSSSPLARQMWHEFKETFFDEQT